MNYYISDLHLGHFKALEYDNRPFCTVEEQNEIITERWNEEVSPKDHVYILGDVLWNNDLLPEVIKNLNGKKHLILGNHDRADNRFSYYFKTIDTMIKIKDCGRTVTLCHYPIAHWEGADRGWYHFYGHIHMGRDVRPFLQYKQEMLKRDLPYNCYNVGCMLPYMDYTPRPFDYIIEAAQRWEKEEFKKMATKSVKGDIIEWSE